MTVHPADVVANAGVDALRRIRGVRALLINMPLRENAPPNCAPLGPALLAARLRDAGATVSILDLNAYRVADPAKPHGRYLNAGEAHALLERHIRFEGEPNFVGLSGKITTLRWQKVVAAAVARLVPNALLVSGGGLATEFREGLFNWIPQLDGVAQGEGDDLILKIAIDAALVRELGRRRASYDPRLRPYQIGEQWAEDGYRLRLVYAGARPRDIDALPLPAWDLLERDVDGHRVLETYLGNPIWGLPANNSSATPFAMTRSLNTVSSRGCPFACRFCFRGAQGGRQYGIRSASSIVDEFRWMSDRWQVDFIGSLDDNFMVRRDRIDAFEGPLGDLCRERGVRWGTHGRLDEAAAPGCVAAMARGGCAYIGFGAESASPKILEAMGKGGSVLANGTVEIDGRDLPRTMVEGYKNTVAAGVHGNCTWIAGFPGEGIDELKDSVTFVEWQKSVVRPEAVNQHFFTATAYPGTELFRHPRVRRQLAEGFGLAFDVGGEPVCDEALEHYVTALDDATKILADRDGRPVYYGEMPEETFLRVRELIDGGRTSEVLSLA